MMRHQLLASLIAGSLLFATALPGAQQTATAPAVATLATVPDQQFTAGDVTLRYRDLGTGDPIVFVHGYTAALESMIGIANALPPEHRKIALDVRGFGKSSKFGDATQFGQKMVDDVVALMDHLKIQRAHLVGHSMGALISANVAARYPARVASASLVAGPFWGEPDITTESKRWVTDLEKGNGLTNFMLWLLPGTNPQMATAMNAGILKANDLPSLTESMRALPKLSITGLKDGSKVLLVAGTVDPLFPLSTAFAQRTPGSTMLEIQGANHVNVITNAEAVKAMTAQLHR
jgi:pimeloyl-ACP methyl ester carboxylesterase